MEKVRPVLIQVFLYNKAIPTSVSQVPLATIERFKLPQAAISHGQGIEVFSKKRSGKRTRESWWTSRT